MNKIKHLSLLRFIAFLAFVFLAGVPFFVEGETANRSVRLNNMHNWWLTTSEDHQNPVVLEQSLHVLAKRDDIMLTEGLNLYNVDSAVRGKWSGVTPSTIKSINPNAKVYGEYSLMSKADWDSDYPRIKGNVTSATSNSLADANENWKAKEWWTASWVKNTVWIRSGNAKGQMKRIKNYTYVEGVGSTLFLDDGLSWYGDPPTPQWDIIPEAGSEYVFIATTDPIYGNDSRLFTQSMLWNIIEENDWWLRDGNGERTPEYANTPNDGHIWYLDVGAPGFKEEYLKQILLRLDSSRFSEYYPDYGRFDGIVFDYLWALIAGLFTNRGTYPNGTAKPLLPFPKRYAPRGDETAAEVDKNWFENAWKPFFEYVVTGMQAAGYAVLGNEGGNYDPAQLNREPVDWVSRQAWQRQFLNGTVYEQGSVNYGELTGGGWLSSKTIEKRINALANDPLVTWMADSGVSSSDPEYERKQTVSLAMYYVAVPADQSRHSYSQRGNGLPFWSPLWDFYIGTPSADFIQLNHSNGTKRFVWSRKYSNGLVLLDYENSSESTSFSLDGNYIDYQNNSFSGTISLASHTGLILQKTTPTPTSTSTSTSTSTTKSTASTTSTTIPPSSTSTTQSTSSTAPSLSSTSTTNQELYSQYLRNLLEAQEQLSDARLLGLNVSEEDTQVREARDAGDNGDYLQAIEVISLAKKTLEKKIADAQNSRKLNAAAQQAIGVTGIALALVMLGYFYVKRNRIQREQELLANLPTETEGKKTGRW
ncbi:hypothetical protein HY991_00085 [Candidatus Micrarchaeota archaeon]|nr:hypothetical protein [Candidatus Micrarchaeota archaeon]